MSGLDQSGLPVTLDAVHLRYGATTALDDLSLQIPAGSITGLLGRNGSGKTSVLSLLGSYRRPTAGSVLIGGADPFENERVMEQVCLVRESGDVLAEERIGVNLRYAASARPTWSEELAQSLLEVFELRPKDQVKSLSRGKRSALGIVLGLASRAPLTMLDEVHLGMDAPSRYAFYEALLTDYAEHPRTFILSSHLIGELDSMLEHAVVLDRGRLLASTSAEELRTRGMTLVGRATEVATFLAEAGLQVLGERRLGPTTEVTVVREPGADLSDLEARVAGTGIEVGSISLQDLFVHMTDRSQERP
ncbi:ABC transporter ATP-binding protein [Ruania alkalisoli]|uniref:ABC transporter ATP-binding protein n=1 Tax=Ruania alkalisoli TaxID=2779775 RepID=A0A7M1SZJ9_9MICO|nr:ABC transporter ATP-binding protein [Ruania alkalisoli]QOR72063.1 ABC transporter ATP-binding protein [Ruania alkalisoli]